MTEIERYLQILKDFNFEIRSDYENIRRRYYVYGEDDRYTNINWCSNDIDIHTNYKQNRETSICSIKEGDFENLKIDRNYCGDVYTINFRCSDTEEMKKYLSKLYMHEMRNKKLKRITNE